MAMVTGTKPRPSPCRARPARIAEIEGTAAASRQPARTAPSAPSIAVLRWVPSPSRPSTCPQAAPTSSVMVSDHCAVPADTWRVVAMVGTSGAPRLLMTETTAAMAMRVGSNSRVRHPAGVVPGSAVPRGGVTVLVMRFFSSLTSTWFWWLRGGRPVPRRLSGAWPPPCVGGLPRKNEQLCCTPKLYRW